MPPVRLAPTPLVSLMDKVRVTVSPLLTSFGDHDAIKLAFAEGLALVVKLQTSDQSLYRPELCALTLQ